MRLIVLISCLMAGTGCRTPTDCQPCAPASCAPCPTQCCPAPCSTGCATTQNPCAQCQVGQPAPADGNVFATPPSVPAQTFPPPANSSPATTIPFTPIPPVVVEPTMPRPAPATPMGPFTPFAPVPVPMNTTPQYQYPPATTTPAPAGIESGIVNPTPDSPPLPQLDSTPIDPADAPDTDAPRGVPDPGLDDPEPTIEDPKAGPVKKPTSPDPDVLSPLDTLPAPTRRPKLNDDEPAPFEAEPDLDLSPIPPGESTGEVNNVGWIPLMAP